LIISDISIKLDTDLLHLEWKWDAISLGDLDSSVITPQLALLEENGLFRPTLSDLHELKLHQKQGIHWWTTLANFVGNAVMMLSFVLGPSTWHSVSIDSGKPKRPKPSRPRTKICESDF
jgi:hypothetical protein